MCRLTKKQTQQLRTAVEHLRRGYKCLHGENIVIGRLVPSVNGNGPSQSVQTDSGICVQILQKGAQGDINGFDFAMRHLLSFLETHGFEEQHHRARVIEHDTL